MWQQRLLNKLLQVWTIQAPIVDDLLMGKGNCEKTEIPKMYLLKSTHFNLTGKVKALPVTQAQKSSNFVLNDQQECPLVYFLVQIFK